MPAKNKRLLILILITTLTGLTGLVGNIASNQLPQRWQPYLWLAWPILVLFLLLTVVALIWQTRLEVDPPLNLPSLSPAPLDEPSQFDVFISYSRADEEAVTKLTKRLRADGFTLWVDEEQIGGGDPLRQVMVDGIKQSRHMMCCLSPDYLTSKWGTFESAVNQALDPDNRNRRLIPVQIATVAIPPEYKWLYCPDLTNSQTWEQEYHRAIKYLRLAQKRDVSEGHTESNDDVNRENDEGDNENISEVASYTGVDPESLGNVDTLFAPPGLYLQALGFQFDPFAYPEAESMPATMVENTFVSHPSFDEDVMDLARSTVLLAQPGSGKTAALRRLQSTLIERRQRSFKGILEDDEVPRSPLVAIYNTFSDLTERLPEINLRDHARTLLAAVANATWEFVEANPNQFLVMNSDMQNWWRQFMQTFLYGTPPLYRIRNRHLTEAWRQMTASTQMIEFPTNLEHVLEELLHVQGPLQALGLDSLFILTDGIDGYEKQSLPDLAALIAPLLTPRLLSLQGIIWKFFLPNILEEKVRQSSGCKTGRVKAVSIQWDESSLIKFLQARLKWASTNQILGMAALCEEDILIREVDIEKGLAQIALQHDLGPPRALLGLAEQLLHLQARQATDSYISLEAWNAFQFQIQEELKQDRETLHANEEKRVELLENRFQNAEHRIRLAEKIEKAFNLEELSGLCARLDINYENVDGRTLQSKSQELVKYLYRRNQLARLVILLQEELRPLTKWF